MDTKQLPDDLNPEVVKACAEFIGKITGLVPPPHNAFPPEWHGYLRSFTSRLYEVARENTNLAPSDAAQAASKLVPTTATDEMLIALLSGGEADALTGCKDGYTASRLLQASGVAERYSAMLAAAPVAPAAVAPINLEGLRKRLLTPRKILRDENGWLWHMDYPVFDEGTRADRFLEAIGIEPAFVAMESDLPDFAERYHDEGLSDCTEWTPTPPAGEDWLLLEIYDTEDGPYALFGRDAYQVEQARKREHTRQLAGRYANSGKDA